MSASRSAAVARMKEVYPSAIRAAATFVSTPPDPRGPVPVMLLRTASRTFDSTIGTCFNAAAWKTTSGRRASGSGQDRSGGLRAPPLQAGEPVGGVADEREVVGDGLGQDAELLLHPCGVEPLVLAPVPLPDLVPDELVHAITASGTPEEAKAKVEEYKKRGCTCPILYPVGGNFKLLIDTFAQN